MVESSRGARGSRPLHPDEGTGEADIESGTGELDEARPRDATAEPAVPSAIARLGVEARAEYIRVRRRLGLGDEPEEPPGDRAEALVPRRGCVVLAATLSVGLGLGLVAAELSSGDAPPCRVLESIEEVAAMPELERVRSRPELRPMEEELQELIGSMREEAEALCQPANDDQVVRRERLSRWIEYLRRTLESPAIGDPARLQQALEFLGEQRWNALPPRESDETYSTRLRDDLHGALEGADDATASAGDRALDPQPRRPGPVPRGPARRPATFERGHPGGARRVGPRWPARPLPAAPRPLHGPWPAPVGTIVLKARSCPPPAIPTSSCS